MSVKYPIHEEIMTSPQELFEMTKIKKLWDYLQIHFEMDLEVFTHILLACEKAGKEKWTDEELISLARTLKTAQDNIGYQNIVENIVTGQH